MFDFTSQKYFDSVAHFLQERRVAGGAGGGGTGGGGGGRGRS